MTVEARTRTCVADVGLAILAPARFDALSNKRRPIFPLCIRRRRNEVQLPRSDIYPINEGHNEISRVAYLVISELNIPSTWLYQDFDIRRIDQLHPPDSDVNPPWRVE